MKFRVLAAGDSATPLPQAADAQGTAGMLCTGASSCSRNTCSLGKVFFIFPESSAARLEEVVLSSPLPLTAVGHRSGELDHEHPWRTATLPTTPNIQGAER